MIEILLARYTSPNGDPLDADSRDLDVKHFLKGKISAGRPGWFYTGATESAAALIRRHGHKAVGTKVVTWIPPQAGLQVLDVAEPDGDWRTFTLPDGIVLVGSSYATASAAT